uniref:50S ribosomal protein L20 n=1 Tax=Nephromyces sp. ex Molgula occidentalis TaxID=2544991 RepID=A0A5C1H818_9APIC|nr:hypothetical protein [Nephromyces sp. ex Molgula occidentalis]
MISLKTIPFKKDKQKYLKANVLSYKHRKKQNIKHFYLEKLKIILKYKNLNYSILKNLLLKNNINLNINILYLLLTNLNFYNLIKNNYFITTISLHLLFKYI